MIELDPKILERLVRFRREVHEYPQISLKEFQTQKRVRSLLLEFGVEHQAIKELAGTGLIVDLKGKGPAKGEPRCVAFRADMDALSMIEENPHLPYESKNKGAAHMCGHDGHMACLLSFVPFYLLNRQQFPSDSTVRLLFQPSEEGPVHGAQLMIDAGCLQGVDEVYGFHNWPVGNFGDLWCKAGPVMSKITIVKIKIIGTGGHGSQPEILKVAIWKAIWFYTEMLKFIDELHKTSQYPFACTFPVFNAGERYNVISESALIEGTLRTFDASTQNAILDKIASLLKSIQSEGFKYDLQVVKSVLTANSQKEAQNVLRVGRALLGNQKVGHGTLPFKASEDFGCYTMVKPGAYFFFCTKKKQEEVFLHNSHFDFKDQLIPIAANFWLKLALDRLGSQ